MDGWGVGGILYACGLLYAARLRTSCEADGVQGEFVGRGVAAWLCPGLAGRVDDGVCETTRRSSWSR